MKRYQAYKDSGTEWLEEIPSGWSVLKMKYLVNLITEKSQDTSTKKIALENIESGTGRFVETKSTFEGVGVAFKKGDILFGKLRPYLRKVWQATFEGQSVGDIYVFRAKDGCYPDFIKYVILSDKFISIVNGSTYGAKMPRASWDFISQMNIALPPYYEQVQVAAFLDYKLGLVDKLIAEKEGLVKDMQAYRTSFIFETATKGLNRHARMKDSGIEWIEEIPENWSIIKLGWIFNIKAGGDAKPEFYNDTKDDLHPYPVYTNAREENQVYAYTSKPLFPKESITVTGRGDIGHAILRRDCFDAIIRLLVLEPIDITITDCRYYTYFINNVMHFDTDSSAVGQLSALQLAPYIALQPPISEQNAISDYLDVKTSQIDEIIAEVRKQIDDLKAYKQSLITEAVTGQIDVRNWKRPSLELKKED